MFGLESHRQKKPVEQFEFDLEKELKSISQHKEIKAKIEERFQKIKEILRTGGDDKEEINRLGHLLHGYAALLKVMSRFTPKAE